MNKILTILLLGSIVAGAIKYNGSTTASVVLAGGIIKAQTVHVDKKYKRKDCPVCHGTGWYISGDKISKVECGYCETDKPNGAPAYSNPKIIVHPPITITPNCQTGTCAIRK